MAESKTMTPEQLGLDPNNEDDVKIIKMLNSQSSELSELKSNLNAATLFNKQNVIAFAEQEKEFKRKLDEIERMRDEALRAHDQCSIDLVRAKAKIKSLKTRPHDASQREIAELRKQVYSLTTMFAGQVSMVKRAQEDLAKLRRRYKGGESAAAVDPAVVERLAERSGELDVLKVKYDELQKKADKYATTIQELRAQNRGAAKPGKNTAWPRVKTNKPFPKNPLAPEVIERRVDLLIRVLKLLPNPEVESEYEVITGNAIYGSNISEVVKRYGFGEAMADLIDLEKRAYANIYRLSRKENRQEFLDKMTALINDVQQIGEDEYRTYSMLQLEIGGFYLTTPDLQKFFEDPFSPFYLRYTFQNVLITTFWMSDKLLLEWASKENVYNLFKERATSKDTSPIDSTVFGYDDDDDDDDDDYEDTEEKLESETDDDDDDDDDDEDTEEKLESKTDDDDDEDTEEKLESKTDDEIENDFENQGSDDSSAASTSTSHEITFEEASEYLTGLSNVKAGKTKGRAQIDTHSSEALTERLRNEAFARIPPFRKSVVDLADLWIGILKVAVVDSTFEKRVLASLKGDKGNRWWLYVGQRVERYFLPDELQVEVEKVIRQIERSKSFSDEKLAEFAEYYFDKENTETIVEAIRKFDSKSKDGKVLTQNDKLLRQWSNLLQASQEEFDAVLSKVMPGKREGPGPKNVKKTIEKLILDAVKKFDPYTKNKHPSSLTDDEREGLKDAIIRADYTGGEDQNLQNGYYWRMRWFYQLEPEQRDFLLRSLKDLEGFDAGTITQVLKALYPGTRTRKNIGGRDQFDEKFYQRRYDQSLASSSQTTSSSFFAQSKIAGKIASSSSEEQPSGIRLFLYTDNSRPAIVSIDDPVFNAVDKQAYMRAPFDRDTLVPHSFSSTPSTASLHFPFEELTGMEGELTRFARTPGSVDTKVAGTITRQNDTVYVSTKGKLYTFDGDDESLSIAYTEPSVEWKAFAHIGALSKDVKQIENVQYALAPGTLSAAISCNLRGNKIYVSASVANSAQYDIDNVKELVVRHWPRLLSQQQQYAEDEQPRAKARAGPSFSVPVLVHTPSPYEITLAGQPLKSKSTTNIQAHSLDVSAIEWAAYFADVERSEYPAQKAFLTIVADGELSLPDLPCNLVDQGQTGVIRFSQKVDGVKTPLEIVDSNPVAVVKNYETSAQKRTSITTCTLVLDVLERDVKQLKTILVAVDGLQEILSPTTSGAIGVEKKPSSNVLDAPSSSQSVIALTLKPQKQWPSSITLTYTKI